MPAIYAAIDDCINKSTFECLVGEGYVERIPLYFKRYPDRAPLFTNPHGYAKAKLTVAQMVAMERGGENFAIVNNSDVPLIIEFLRMYTDSIAEFAKTLERGDPDTVFYYHALKFLEALQQFKERGSHEFNAKHNVEERHSPSDKLGKLFG